MVDHEDLEFVRRVAEPLRDSEPVEPEFEARVLSAVRAAAGSKILPFSARRAHRASPGSAGWLTARRKLEVSPLAGLAAAACFAAVVASTTLILSAEPRPTVGAVAAERAVANDEPRLVHFAIVAPTAGKVTLVGDFNGWNAGSTPMVKGAVEGLWLVTVPLDTGSYQYAFVIDGTKWMADPAGAVALEDEFGTPSSILTIGEGSA